MQYQQPQKSRGERMPLTPGIKNSLESEDEMMTLGPLLLCLGLATVILVIVCVAIL